MRLRELQMDSSCSGEFNARAKFGIDDYDELRYLQLNKSANFKAVPQSIDGILAKHTVIDDVGAHKTARGVKDGVIFNPPATILIRNGKKYISKAHDEEFDEEKGLLMCLAKASGITHLELKRMIKNAKRF